LIQLKVSFMHFLTIYIASILSILPFSAESVIFNGPKSNNRILRREDENLLILPTSLAKKDTIISPLILRLIRGGNANSVDNRKGDLKSSISNLSKFWSRKIQGGISTLTKPLQSIQRPSFLQSPSEHNQNEIIEQLQKTPIMSVSVPNSTLLSNEFVKITAKRAGILGRPLQTQATTEMFRSLNQWYQRQGFVLHRVTSATLVADTQTAELSVQEPVSHVDPVAITFCREMIIDPSDGSLVTMKQYQKKKHTGAKIEKSSLNTTYVPRDSAGRTNPKRIASAMGLVGGEPFRWDAQSWNRIKQSNIFRNILKTTPARMSDGTAQLQLIVEEQKTQNLGFGVAKTLYSDGWQGEIDGSVNNLLGGGERLTFKVGKGTQDEEPSINLEFRNDKFGKPGGYGFRVFSDFIGENSTDSNEENYDHDALLDRKGASINLLRNPITESFGVSSEAKFCFERTSTKDGRHDSIGSSSLSIGPIGKQLPFGARTSIAGKTTIGIRFNETSLSTKNEKLLPFTSLTATTQQTFPLASLNKNPVILALRHAATISSSNLPRHEANAQGVACNIRGYKGKAGRVSTSLVGTTELRVPLPRLDDSKVVLYGDWCTSKATGSSSFTRRSSVGIGFRKGLQGIPLKYDISYTGDGEIKTFFEIGPDFEA